MRKVHLGEDALSNSNAYLYLDLQNLDDLNKLREPMLFFQANQDVTICLDEIQLVPELFFLSYEVK